MGGRPIKVPVVLNEKEQTSDSPDHQIVTYEFDKFTAVWDGEIETFPGDDEANKLLRRDYRAPWEYPA